MKVTFEVESTAIESIVRAYLEGSGCPSTLLSRIACAVDKFSREVSGSMPDSLREEEKKFVAPLADSLRALSQAWRAKEDDWFKSLESP